MPANRPSINSKCELCGSGRLNRFTSEIGLHFPGLKGLDKPIVWVFPEILVCLECGVAEFAVPEKELEVLRDQAPAEGAG
jgi:hypothetical protein